MAKKKKRLAKKQLTQWEAAQQNVKPLVLEKDLDTYAMVLKDMASQNTKQLYDYRQTRGRGCNNVYDECGNLKNSCAPENIGYPIVETCCIDEFNRLHTLDKHLPALRSTVEILTSLIMSQSLLGTDDTSTAKLNEFFTELNPTRQSNIEAFSRGIAHSLIYGRCGFRWLSNGSIVFVPSNRYAVVYKESEVYTGVNEVVGYLVARPHVANAFGETYELAKDTFVIDFENEYAESENYVFLLSDQFYNFHFGGNPIEYDTPLNHDVDRIDMFLFLAIQLKTAISDANKDILTVSLAEDLFAMNHQQASELVASSKVATDKREKSVIDQVQRFSDVIANSSGRDTFVVPPTVAEIEELASEIEVSDYVSLYNYMESFVASLYGLSSNVLTLENMPRDASANPIFEQMMKTSIYPKRDTIIRFLNRFLVPKLGISELHFQEESYALGLRLQNAQAVATVIATIESDEHVVPDDIIESMIWETLRNTHT